jgi:pyruvate kinase
VAMMDRIIHSTEQHKLYRSIIAASSSAEEHSPPHAVAAAAAGLAENIGAAAIVGFTSSGTTAVRIARKRPALPILAITPNLQVARQMALVWGAHSVHSQDIRSYEEMVSVATSIACAQEVARHGDLLLVVAGIPFGQTGSTNNLRVVRVE